MKKKRVRHLPKCDFANLAPTASGECEKAEYDVPVKAGSGSSWAYCCQAHYEMFAQPGADKLGFKLVEGIAEPLTNTLRMGKEPGLEDLDYWERVLMEGIREINCPECGEGRSMEPDADGVYNCEGCGIRIKCPAPPM